MTDKITNSPASTPVGAMAHPSEAPSRATKPPPLPDIPEKVLDWLGVRKMGSNLLQTRQIDYMKPHFDRSRTNILKAADHVLRTRDGTKEKPTALILGAGNCLDIPLHELAKNFRVILADLDLEGPRKASDGLEEVSHILWDITDGYITSTGKMGIVFSEQATNLKHGLEIFFSQFNNQPVPTPDFYTRHEPDLVVSSMVLSQLITFPMRGLQNALVKFFRTLPHLDNIVQLFRLDLIGQLIEAHLRGLQNSVLAGATVYVSTDTASHTYPLLNAPRYIPLIYTGTGKPVEHLPTKTNHNIKILSSDNWTWTFAKMDELVTTPEMREKARILELDLNADATWRSVESQIWAPAALSVAAPVIAR